MPTRMDIELTSRLPDGGWTWRAAGARNPRGSMGAEVVPDGLKVGDVVRAEVESGLEGIAVLSVAPPPEPEGLRGQRIEVVGPTRSAPDVSVTLTSGPRRRRERDRPERRRRDRERGDGERRPGSGRPRDRDPERGPSGDRERWSGRAGADAAGGREGREGRGARRAGPRDRRPTVSTAHRNAALAEMKPEEVPIAEQLMRGGLPAVREAIKEQNERAEREGRPTVAAEPLMAAAERLAPVVNLATWKDRASSAQAAGRDVRLRELRAVVAASRTVALDQEGRTMAKALREALEQRSAALREEWLGRITSLLDQGRVAEALQVSARPPEYGTRCPADLAVRLAKDAGQALSTDVAVQDWLAVLAAVTESPVRRSVHPSGIPDDPAARSEAMKAAGLVPDLAKLLGLPVPPPPPPPARRAPVRDRVGTRAGPRKGA